MNNFEKVYEAAADRYGLITVEDAADLGIHRNQLLLWEAMGRLERCGRGVYRLNHHVPTPVDESKGGDSGAFAEEMAIKGDVQPNPRFHPLGLKYLDETPADLRFLDWRPVVKSRAD